MRNFFKNIGDLLIEDIDDANNAYYIAVSRFTELANAEIAEYDSSYYESDFNFREELMFGKKLTSADITFLINREEWTSNTVYAQYDDKDSELNDKKYYIINTNNDVYKCIDNNNEEYSTVEPTSKTQNIFELADGYKWKYMYSLSTSNNTKFGSATLIPVDANTTISAAAIEGTIEKIVIEDEGMNYEKYFVGSIQEIVSNTIFKIDSSANSSNDYYSDTSLYFTSGIADGEISPIIDHYSNASGIYVVTEDSISTSLFSTFIISPTVIIEGNGTGCKAYSSIDANTGIITAVTVINPGTNYRNATASIKSNEEISGTGAILRPIISPVRGHGFDAVNELNAEKLMIKTEFSGNESNNIPTEISFRKYGILKNPAYANGDLFDSSIFVSTISFEMNLASLEDTFEIGEKVVGATSNAVAIVAFANTTYFIGTLFDGTFANGEIITSSNSNIDATIFNINNPEIDIMSGEILAYDVTTEIIRSNNSFEDIGFILSNISGS